MMEYSLSDKKVSVIIPVFNAQNFLARCLDSVISQSYKNFEIICVNDGSTDSSGAILDFYANNYQNIEVLHIENKGVSNARNLGIKRAKGDYILFIDADDKIEPLLFEKAMRVLEEDPADVCVYDVIINKYGRIKKKHSIRNVEEGNIGCLDKYDTFADYFLNGPRSACNRFFSRSFIQKESLVFPHLNNGEDGIFIIVAYSKARKIIYLPYAGYHYIFNKSSATQVSRDEKFIYSICLFYNAAQKLSNRFTEFDYMKVINTHFLNAYTAAIGDFVIEKESINKKECKEQFDRMLAESPYHIALRNIDFSYLSLAAKFLLHMGKLTYRKICIITKVKRMIKNIIKHI